MYTLHENSKINREKKFREQMFVTFCLIRFSHYCSFIVFSHASMVSNSTCSKPHPQKSVHACHCTPCPDIEDVHACMGTIEAIGIDSIIIMYVNKTDRYKPECKWA